MTAAEPAVGIAQDQQPVRPFLADIFVPLDQDAGRPDLAKLLPRTPRVCVRLADPQFVEEDVAQVGIVVLAGMDQHVIRKRPACE